jgi:hypothetical protein
MLVALFLGEENAYYLSKTAVGRTPFNAAFFFLFCNLCVSVLKYEYPTGIILPVFSNSFFIQRIGLINEFYFSGIYFFISSSPGSSI